MALPFLPYREPKIVPSCPKLKAVFTKEKIKSVLIVTDHGIVRNGLTAALEKVLHDNGVRFAVYADTKPNPTVKNVEDAPMIGANKFINAVKTLNANMNIPRKLTGIQQEDIPALAKHAAKEANPLYPVPKLMTQKDLSGFYEQVADWSN